MNDFSELENRLRNLRPAAPSEDLVARIQRALAEPANSGASVSETMWTRWWRFTEWSRGDARDIDGKTREGELFWKRANQTPYKIGLGLAAAAAVFLIFARIHVDHPLKTAPTIATTAPKTSGVPPEVAGKFVPAAFTEVVYNRRDEGLQFPTGSDQPMRRIRFQKRETVRWRNPATGATLNVSYPAEEISLVSAPGQ